MSRPILPPAVLGMIGGGQLGMMTVREAHRMGYRSVIWDPDPDCPAARLADDCITAPFDDFSAAERLVQKADILTYEFENVDPGVVEWVEGRKEIYPGHRILRVARHRRMEKEELQRRGYPTVPFQTATGKAELSAAVESIGLPIMVKTATSGYDGKGQALLRDKTDIEALLAAEVVQSVEHIVEKFIDLQCEVSVIAVRGKKGEVTTLPVSENIHRENILHTTFLPARVSPEVRREAVNLGRSIIEEFQLIGVLCVEMFVTKDNKVLINELAPRPHNSGHASLDVCSVSQFEVLVRSICGLPIPEPTLLSPCAMVNLLGRHLSNLDVEKLLQMKGAKLHLYGKKRTEAKRKMGHITLIGESREQVEQLVAQVYKLMGEEESLDDLQSLIAKEVTQ